MIYIKKWPLLSCVVMWVLYTSCGDWHELDFHGLYVHELTVFISDTAEGEQLSPFESHHLDVFNGETHQTERDFLGNSFRVQFTEGKFKLLLYNNDYEYLHVDYAKDDSYIVAYTGKATSVIAIQDTVFPLRCDVHEIPELLYAGTRDDYDSRTKGEDDYWDDYQGVYVHNEKIVIDPLVYKYKLIVHLSNNKGRINASGFATISGLMPEVRIRGDDLQKPPIAHQFTTSFIDDCLYGDMRSFGRGRDPTIESICYLVLYYSEGGSRIVPVDITNRMNDNPRGGIIEIWLDVDQYGKPEYKSEVEIGIKVEVSGWDRVDHEFSLP